MLLCPSFLSCMPCSTPDLLIHTKRYESQCSWVIIVIQCLTTVTQTSLRFVKIKDRYVKVALWIREHSFNASELFHASLKRVLVGPQRARLHKRAILSYFIPECTHKHANICVAILPRSCFVFYLLNQHRIL